MKARALQWQGQRRRIDVALLLALAEVSQAASGGEQGTIFADEVLDSLDAATGSLDCDGPATSSLRRPRDIDDLRSIWAAGAAAANESTHLFLGWQLSRAMQRFGAGAMEQFVLELSGDQQTDAALRTCLVIANDETVSALLLWELQRLDNAVLDLSINLGEFVP
jgi:hypothetical protein